MIRPPYRPPRPFVPFQLPEPPLYSESNQNKNANFIGREVALFGKYELTVFPNSNLSFKPLVNYPFTKEERCLLDNLWRSSQKQDTKYLIACLNSLCEYFNQKRKGFNFFVVFQGKQPGVYQTWVEVAEQIQNFPSPVYKGFNNLQEAFEAAKLTIGVNYYITPALRFTKDNLVTYSVGKSTEERIVFCDHCQTLTNTIRTLNEKLATKETFLQRLRTEVHQLQDKQDMMLSVKNDAELIKKLQLENSMLKEQCIQLRKDSIDEAEKTHRARFINSIFSNKNTSSTSTQTDTIKEENKLTEEYIKKMIEDQISEKVQKSINDYFDGQDDTTEDPIDDPIHPDGGYSETHEDELDQIAIDNINTAFGK